MSPLLLVAGLVAAVIVGVRWYRSRREEKDRDFGQLIARRYQSDDLAPAAGSPGLGRLARARSAPSAYTVGRNGQ